MQVRAWLTGKTPGTPLLGTILMTMRPCIFTAVLAILSTVCVTAQEEIRVNARLLSAERIWDEGPHNAFTDLVRWRGRFYCAFREGTGHAEGLGTIRVIVSGEGEAWQSVGVLEREGYDLRDAHLAVTPDDRLMEWRSPRTPATPRSPA